MKRNFNALSDSTLGGSPLTGLTRRLTVQHRIDGHCHSWWGDPMAKGQPANALVESLADATEQVLF